MKRFQSLAAFWFFESHAVADGQPVAAAEGGLDALPGLQLSAHAVGNEIVERLIYRAIEDKLRADEVILVGQLPGQRLPFEQLLLLHASGSLSLSASLTSRYDSNS